MGTVWRTTRESIRAFAPRLAIAAAVATAAGLIGFGLFARPAEAGNEETIVLEDTITTMDTGRYLYLPFEMPEGVKRVSVKLEKTPSTSATGLGIFDQRGPQYGSPGFRGIYGEEDQDFFIEPDDASVSFVPGRIDPGRWTVIVPVFRGLSPVWRRSP